MFPKKTVRDIELSDRKVLVRVDFDTPMKGDQIADDARIREAIPTIKYLQEAGGRTILLSHLGRPGGKVDPSLSLAPAAHRLGELIGGPVAFSPEALGPQATAAVEGLSGGGLLMLENLRFHPGEEQNDYQFIAELAKFGEVFVLEGFAVAHRSHASVVGLPTLLPGVAGFGIEREYDALTGFLAQPERPFWALLGGAKVSTKIGVFQKLLPSLDGIILGGAMANTFLKHQGLEIGASVYEPESLEQAGEIEADAGRSNKSFLLPTDAVVGRGLDATKTRVCPVSEIKVDELLLDIGPETIEQIEAALGAVEQVVWNGPFGYAENPRFSGGTLSVARAVAARPKSLVVGGDTVAALGELDFKGDFTHVSTGGGAALEFIEKGTLVGIDALEDV